MLGVSQQTVARWESGRGAVPTKYLRDLAVVLSLSVNALLGTEPIQERPLPTAPNRLAPPLDDDPYGTLRVDFVPAPGERNLSADGQESSFDFNQYEYPITEGARSSVYSQLETTNPEVSWLCFDTLDNRVVFVNLRAVEAVAMIGDDAEAMPSFEPMEFYRALSEPEMQQLLESTPDLSTFESEEAPYSRKLYEASREYVSKFASLDEVFTRLKDITIETIGGRRDTLFYDDDAPLLDLHMLSMAIDDPETWLDDRGPVNEWMLNLYSEGYYRSTHYRLGALRLIEVPLIVLENAVERMLAVPSPSGADAPEGDPAPR